MAGIIFSKGSNLNDSVFGKSQEPIKMFLESKVEAYQDMGAMPKIFRQETSKNAMDKYTSMTSMNGFEPVGEGGAYPNDEMQEGFSKIIEYETWKDQFVITQEMVEDSKLMDFKSRPAAFINGYNRTRELFAAALIAGGMAGTSVMFKGKRFDTSAADGKPLFDTAHLSKVKGGNQSNKFEDAFSNDALMKLETVMQGFKDDNGNILSIAPDTIIIPNDATLKKEVFAAIGADKDPNTANNGFNYTFGRWTVIVWPYLNQFIPSGSKPWILMASQYNEENGGAIWGDRIPLTVKSYIDENTDNNIWKGRARFNAGFNDWRAFAVGGIPGGSSL
jgi:hypothetical protein